MDAENSARSVALTGASGHIGFHVAGVLLERGYEVHLLIRRVNENVEILEDRGATIHVCDLFDRPTYVSNLKGKDALFHLAAVNSTRTDQREQILKSTVGLTREIVSAAEEADVPTLIYTSSVVVLGRSDQPERLIDLNQAEDDPISPYVEGKIEAERFLDGLSETGGLDIRRLYPSWIVGPGNVGETPPQKLIREYAAKGQRFYFAGGISIADVESVAQAHVDAWEKGKPGDRFLLGGDNIEFREFYETLSRLTGKAKPLFRAPKFLMRIAAHLLKVVDRIKGVSDSVDPAYIDSVVGSYSWYDSSKAVEELGYRIPPAADTLSSGVKEARVRSLSIPVVNRLENPVAEDSPVWLLTGVPGWLGNRLVEMMVDRIAKGELTPVRIRLLCENRFRDLIVPGRGIEAVFGDIRDGAILAEALEGVTTVFHLAGAIYPPRTRILYEVNTEGTRALADACVSAGVRRLIFIGTDSICGKGTKTNRIFDENTPASPYRHYGRSKYLAEKAVLDRTAEGQLDGTSLRGFWFFGPHPPPRQKEFFKMFSWRRQLVFGNGKNYRSITTTDNLCHAALTAVTHNATIGKWYWIGDQKPDYLVDEIYGKIASRLGTSYRPLYIPVILCQCCNLLDWLMAKVGGLHPTIHAAGKFYFDIAGTIDAAQRDFGYEPIHSFYDEVDCMENPLD